MLVIASAHTTLASQGRFSKESSDRKDVPIALGNATVSASPATLKVDTSSMIDELIGVASDLNKLKSAGGSELTFSIDQSSKELIVRVVEKETGEVIREIPVQSFLQSACNLQALKGILFSQMA